MITVLGFNYNLNVIFFYLQSDIINFKNEKKTITFLAQNTDKTFSKNISAY